MKYIPATTPGQPPCRQQLRSRIPEWCSRGREVLHRVQPEGTCGGVLFSEISVGSSTFLPSFAPHPLRRFLATMKALTPAGTVPRVLFESSRLLPSQVSWIHGRRLPVVLSPTTWCARSSSMVLCGYRDRHPSFPRKAGFRASPLASRLAATTRPNRVRYPTDRRFISGCSPPHLAVTQLPSISDPRTSSGEDLHLSDTNHSPSH
jgi:hypothetical protein